MAVVQIAPATFWWTIQGPFGFRVNATINVTEMRWFFILLSLRKLVTNKRYLCCIVDPTLAVRYRAPS